MFCALVIGGTTWHAPAKNQPGLLAYGKKEKSTSRASLAVQYRSCRIEIILLYPISRGINGIDVTHFYSERLS